MNIQDLIKSAVQKGFTTLYNTTIETVEFQATRKDFEGDITIVVFPFLRIIKGNPIEIGTKLGNYLKGNVTEIKDFNVVKGFLNLVLDDAYFLNNFNDIYNTENFGYSPAKADTKSVMVEYSSPNTNKPLHLGHIRNNLLGYSVAEILKANGLEVIKVNLVNDRGIHICKSMFAYKKWGNKKEPNIKSDHFVGEFYVKYNQMEKEDDKLIEEVYNLLRLWEENDPEVRALWKKMNSWALKGFKATFNKTEDGAIFADLKESYNLPNKFLIRRDGTSLYITQDIYLAFQKKEDFNYDKSIYVVGNEQDLYFKQLFAVLDMIGFKEDKFHLSYGMIYLPEGKMKSREGTIVDADDIIAKIQLLAYEEVNKRYPELTEEKKKERAKSIGMAALSFFILKFNPKSDFIFNPKESISFEGETGPYILLRKN